MRPADPSTLPEHDWVAACLRALGRRALPPAPADGLDWNALLDAAEIDDLLPALAYAARAGPWTGVPAAARRRLAAALATCRARHLVMMRELASVLRRCAADGIEVIVLKGPVLADTLYPQPPLRPFNDLDLLVRPADRLRADAALRALGHRRVADEHSWEFDIAYEGATVYDAPGGVRIDLHWALLTEPRYAWNREAADAVWERARPIEVAGQRALGLGREDQLLHLATHLAVHHTLAGLLRLWDIALLLDRAGGGLDWQALLARAEQWRVRRALFFVLLGVEAAFPSVVPVPVLAALRPRGPRAALLTVLLRGAGIERRIRLEHLVTLLLIDRAGDACGSVRQALWPSADWLRARYGAEAASRRALYLAHVRRLAGVLGGTSGGLVRVGTGRG